MAKRFTDTDKWKSAWFRRLKPAHKLLWIYVLDNCDHAGIWQVDFDLASFQIGIKLDLQSAIKDLKKQAFIFAEGTRWFITDFVDFQYHGELKPNNHAHGSVIALLKRFGLWESYLLRKQAENDIEQEFTCDPPEGHTRVTRDPQDMDKDKDMDKDQDKDDLKGGAGGKQKHPFFSIPEFQAAWAGWLEMRKSLKSSPTPRAEVLAMNKLLGLCDADVSKAIEIIDQSTRNSWKDFFPLKENSNGKDIAGRQSRTFGEKATTGSGTSERRATKSRSEFPESLQL